MKTNLIFLHMFLLLQKTLLLFDFNYIRDLTNRRKLFSIPVAEYTSFSHHTRTLKTSQLVLISRFFTYYFKTSTISILFLSSRVFTALELDSNHFDFLLWKLVKQRDHNEIKPYFENINQSDIILWCL